MEKEIKVEQGVAKQELTPEQRRYLASFKGAMDALERKYRKERHWPNEFKALVRSRLWSPDLIAFCYTAIAGNISPLPKRQRDYIVMVAGLAKELFEKATELGNEKD